VMELHPDEGCNDQQQARQGQHILKHSFHALQMEENFSA